MNAKKLLAIVISFVLVIVLGIVFMNVFAFESEEDEASISYPEVDDELIQKLYSYLPNEEENNFRTFYNVNFTKFQNLSFDFIQSTVYNYLVQYEKDKLTVLTLEELKSHNIISNQGSNYTPLYKIKTEDIERVGKIIFGSDVIIPQTDFTMSSGMYGVYVDNECFVYQKQNIENKYFIERKIDKYSVTDGGATIIIYDYFTKCEKSSSLCYNDTKLDYKNVYIQNEQGTTNLATNLTEAAHYKHVFKYADGNYYWYSSEMDNNS